MTDRILSINDLLLEQCYGDYQWDLISGQENWSGSSLRGEAARWGGVYSESRGHLLQRIQRALRQRGWRATLGYVLMGKPRRWNLRLLLVDPDGRVYDQVTGDRLADTTTPSECYTPGYEVRAVAA